MLAILPVAGFASSTSAATTDTWTGSAGVNWATIGDWTTTNAGGIPVTGDSLLFTGLANLNSNNNLTGLSVAGITFDATAGGYVLTGNSLALTGGIINNAATTESIGMTLTGTAGLNYSGTGILQLSGPSNYTGNTLIANGTVIVNAGGTLGAVTNVLTLGTTATNTVGALTLNTNATIGGLTVTTMGASANLITIASGNTLTINGITTMGIDPGAVTNTTKLTVTGTGASVVAGGGNFTIGTAGTTTGVTTTLDMSGLTSFTYNSATSIFAAGLGSRGTGILSLPTTANGATSPSDSITALSIQIGSSNGGSNAGVGTSSLRLGSGTNTLNADTIFVGAGTASNKSNGNIVFSSATGNLTIRGTAGTTRAAITIADHNGSGSQNNNSSVTLTGHNVDILASTLAIAKDNGNASATGTLTFDQGTIDATTITLATSSNTTLAGNTTATLTVAGTGSLIVGTGGITLSSSTFATSVSTATLNITGGTVTLAGATGNITRGTATGTDTGTVILAGGTLDLNNHNIGTAAAPITVVFPALGQTSTLKNVGATAINAAGLTMTGNGTLFLGGTNNYTAATTLSSGTLSVSGTTNAASTVTVNAGTLLGSGTINGTVTLNAGTISGGDTLVGANGTLTLTNGLTVTSGNLAFNIGTSTSNVINITAGSTTFTAGNVLLGLASGATPASGSIFNVLTTTSPLSAGGLTLNPVTVGRTTLTPSISGNNLIVTVGGSAANLTWNNSVGGGDGTTWDTTQLNWTSTASSSANQYFDGDNVTFNDANNFPTNPNAYNVVLNSTVQPGSVTVTTANAYTLSGSGSIAGSTGLALSGGGSLALSTINSYTGNTSVSGAGTTLILNNVGATSNIGAQTATLNINGGTVKWIGASTQTSTMPISISTNGATFDASPTGAFAVAFNGALSYTGSGPRTITLTGTDPSLASQTLGGIIADAGGATSLVKNGANGWLLSGNNNFSGGTTINNGRIRVSNVNGFGSGPVVVASGGEAYLAVTGTFINNFTIAGIGVVESNGTGHYGALRLAANTTVVAGTVTLAADSRITARSATTNSIISGQITGAHALELGNAEGAAVMTLSNLANNWTGDTTVSDGTVKIGASSTALGGVIPHGAGSGNVIINGSDGIGTTANSILDLSGFNITINGLNSSGTLSQDVITNSSTTAASILTVGDNNVSGNYAGTISSGATQSLGFAKIGSGTQTLSGTLSYTGPTNVLTGTLAIVNPSTSNALTSTAINVSSAATLDVTGVTGGYATSGTQVITNNGTIAGNFTLNSGSTINGTGLYGNVTNNGGTISPATTGTTGTISMASLTENSGNYIVDLNGGLTDLIAVSGAASLGGTITVESNAVSVTPGTYTILTASSVTGTATFSTPTSRQVFTPIYNSNSVQLTVTGSAIANLTWNNAGGTGDGTTWDIQGQQNWNNAGTPDVFFPIDNVTFNDNNNFPANPNAYNVNISTTVTPSSTTVNTANTYTFSGGGAIAGTGNLTVTGGGTLILGNSGTNSYTGGTFVQNATVVVNSASAYTGTYTLGDASNHAGIIDVAGNTITVGNVFVTGTGNSVITNNGSGPATINSTNAVEIDAPIVDGLNTNSVHVTASTLVLGGNSTYSGGTTIDSGATLQVGNFAPQGNLNPTGVMNDNGTLAFAILNGTPSVGTVFAETITGSGSISQRGNSGTILTANNSYTGTTTVSTSGFLYVGNGGTTGTLGAGTVTINASSGVGNLVFNRSDTSAIIIPNLFAGSGNLTYEGGGIYTPSSTSSTFTGNVSIIANSTVLLPATGNTAFGAVASGNVSTSGGGTIDLTNVTGNNTLNLGAKQFNIAGNGVSGCGTIYDNAGTTAIVNQITAFEKISLTANASVFTGFVSPTAYSRFDLRGGTPVLNLGSFTLTKNGGGLVALVGGTLTGTGGDLFVNQGSFSFETSSHTTGTGTETVAPGATAEFYQTAAGNFTWNLVFQGDATLGSANTTAANVNGPIAFSGNLSVGPTNSPTGHNDGANDPLNLLGNITESTGGSSLVKFGVDTLTLSGVNAWTGNLTVGNGTVKLGNAAALPAVPVIIGDSGTNSGTLDLNGFSPTVAGLSSNPANTAATSQLVTNSGATPAILTVSTGTSTFTGIIQDGTGGTALTVSSGSLDLSGLNTYTGNTTVSGGTLTIDATGALASGNIAVASSATFAVALGGSIPVTTNLIDNGTVNLSNPATTINTLNSTTPALLTLNSTVLTVTTGGTFVGTIQNGATPGGLIVPSGSVLTTGAINLGSLEVDGHHIIASTTPATLSKIGSLVIAGSYGGSANAASTWTGSLDLTNSKLIIEDTSLTRAADLAQIKDEALASNTTGNVGIFSSTAIAFNTAAGKTVKVVAVVDNAVRIATFPSGSTNFGGGTNNVDASSILVTSAFKGDANLDGVVDIQDLTAVANHWQQSVTDWSQGDFDGSNFVDIQDLTAVANDWQDGVGGGGGSSFNQALAEIGGFTNNAVPEPTSLALLGLGGALLATRRRNKR